MPDPSPARPGVAALSRLLLPLALALVAARCGWALLHALDVFADYHAYYRAAANLRGGHDLYAEGRLLVARNSYEFWTHTDGQYVYPPTLAVALLPLTLLDIGHGGVVWLLALALAIVAACGLAARICGRAVPLRELLAVAATLAGALPLALGLRYGLVAPYPLALAALALGGYAGFVLVARRRGVGGRAIAPVALAFLATGALILLLGLRDGEIDPFLLTLATPGLLGVVVLAGHHGWHGPSWRAGAGGERAAILAALALPFVGGTPLLLGLRYGQSDLFLLLLTGLALLAHLRRREVLAGIALGAAAALKPTLALYGLYYLRKRCWTTLAAAALTGAALGLAPFLLLGREAFADWLAISRYFGGDDYAAYPSNQSLRGLLLRAFVGGPGGPPLIASRALANGLWLILGSTAVIAWWRATSSRRDDAHAATLEYALTVALALLVAPLSEDIHFVGLLLPLALLADRIARGDGAARWRAWAALGCAAFLLPFPDAAPTGYGAVARLIATAPYLWGLLLVGGVLLARLRAGMARDARDAHSVG